MKRARLWSGVGMAAVVLAVAGPVRTHADEPVRLRYKMQPGESRIYRTTAEVKQTQSFAGMAFENEITSIDVIAFTLDRVDDDGNFHLQAENRRLQTTMKLGEAGDYKFDSKSTSNDKSSTVGAALTPIYESLAGAVIQVAHTPRGKVTGVQGLKELIDEDLLKNNPFAAQAATVATDEGAKLSYTDRFIELPEQPVRPGDTWEAPFEFKLPALGEFKGKSIYRYEGRDKVGDRETVRIGVRDELSFDLNIDQMGAKVTGSLSITSSSGTIQFDPAAGALVSKKTTQTLSGNLNVVAGDQNIPIQNEQTHTTTVELVDKVE